LQRFAGSRAAELQGGGVFTTRWHSGQARWVLGWRRWRRELLLAAVTSYSNTESRCDNVFHIMKQQNWT
jgi:hypothetical protein